MMPHPVETKAGASLRHDKANCIRASMGFLQKSSLFQSEEPYAFRYKADVPVPLTNMETEFLDIDICDLRGQEDAASLDDCGFEVRKLRSDMTYAQFADEKAIQSVYLADLKKQLLDDFGATELDYARVRVGGLYAFARSDQY